MDGFEVALDALVEHFLPESEFARKKPAKGQGAFDFGSDEPAAAPKTPSREKKTVSKGPAKNQKSLDFEPKAKQASFDFESSHPRETAAHDGKRPGEFAPKEQPKQASPEEMFPSLAELPEPEQSQEPVAEPDPEPIEESKPEPESDGFSVPEKFDLEKHGGYAPILELAGEIKSGKYTADQYRQLYKFWRSAEPEFTADLESRFNAKQLQNIAANFGSFDAKQNTKAENAKSIYRNAMLHAFHASSDGFFSSGMEGRMVALDRFVAGVQDGYFQKVKAEKDAKQAAEEAKIADPKTLSDFRDAIRQVGGYKNLTDEQRATYDDLVATERRSGEASRKPKTVEGFTGGSESTGATSIVEGWHKKHQKPTFTVTIENHLGDKWDEVLSRAKQLGGNYVNARVARMYGATPGFQFMSKEAAEKFHKTLGGESVDRSDILDERNAGKIENASERMMALADVAKQRAEEKLNQPRLTNTVRRAGMAESVMGQARRDSAKADTFRRIGEGLADGKLKHLAGIRAMTHLDAIESALSRAKYDRWAADDRDISYEKMKERPAEESDIVHAQYPYPSLWQSDLHSDLNALADEPGLKKLAAGLKKATDTSPYKKKIGPVKISGGKAMTANQLDNIPGINHYVGEKAVRLHATEDEKLLKGRHPVAYTADGGKTWGISPDIAVAGALSRGNKLDLIEPPQDTRVRIKDESTIADLQKAVKILKRRSNPSLRRIGENLSSHLEDYNRLQAADIKSDAELRAALREYLPLKKDADKEDPVKKMERNLIGQKIDGFFPTPRPLIDRMLAAADIQSGHSVLEPSAGKGDILDAVREQHPDATTVGIEPVHSLRDLITAKGHELHEDRDFLEHSGQYDRIVMNPPYENRQDVAHLRHAYDRLKPGGRLVAVVSAGPFGGQSKKDQEFRDWIDDVGGEVEDLPANSFNNADAFRKTGVNTRMVTINKPQTAEFSRAIDDALELFSRKPAKGQGSFDFESNHPRESSAHDGKKPGEFAPKQQSDEADSTPEKLFPSLADLPESEPEQPQESASEPGSIAGIKPEPESDPDSPTEDDVDSTPDVANFAIDVPEKTIFASGNKRGKYASFSPPGISVSALRGANAIWRHQGDPQHLIWNSHQKDASEWTKKAAAELIAAKDAGYSLVNHRAGKLGTVWVMKKDGRVLTQRGAEAIASGTGELKFEKQAGRETAKPVIDALHKFISKLPESTQGNLGSLVRAINQSQLGKHIDFGRDEYGNLRVSDKGGSWHIYESTKGNDSSGKWHEHLPSSLPRFLSKLKHMAKIAVGDDHWASHERKATEASISDHLHSFSRSREQIEARELARQILEFSRLADDLVLAEQCFSQELQVDPAGRQGRWGQYGNFIPSNVTHDPVKEAKWLQKTWNWTQDDFGNHDRLRLNRHRGELDRILSHPALPDKHRRALTRHLGHVNNLVNLIDYRDRQDKGHGGESPNRKLMDGLHQKIDHAAGWAEASFNHAAKTLDPVNSGVEQMQFSRPTLAQLEFARKKAAKGQMGFDFDDEPRQGKLGFNESKIKRETTAHDGKRPGEFAPKGADKSFPTAGEVIKKGGSFADWQQPISDAFVGEEIDDDHPAWQSIQHGDDRVTVSGFNDARHLFGKHVRPFGNYGEFGQVTDVSDDGRKLTVTSASGKQSQWSPDELHEIGPEAEKRSQSRGLQSLDKHAEYFGPVLAKEAIEKNENISETMKRHGMSPKNTVIRKAIADSVEKIKNPPPSPARAAAMAKQAGKNNSKAEEPQGNLSEDLNAAVDAFGLSKPSRHWYGLRNRPPGPGAVPKGFVETKPHESFRHGQIAYDRPLTDKETSDYELDPIRQDHELPELAEKVKAGLGSHADRYLDPKNERLLDDRLGRDDMRKMLGHVDREKLKSVLRGDVVRGEKGETEMAESAPHKAIRWTREKIADLESRLPKMEESLASENRKEYKQNSGTIAKKDIYGEYAGEQTIGTVNERRRAGKVQSLKRAIAEDRDTLAKYKRALDNLIDEHGDPDAKPAEIDWKKIDDELRSYLLGDDVLHGGKADGMPDSAFPKKSLAQGKAEESEHTDNPTIAGEIANDHLAEDPKYYDKLKKIESEPQTKLRQGGLYSQADLGGAPQLFDTGKEFVKEKKSASKPKPAESSLLEKIEDDHTERSKASKGLQGQKTIDDLNNAVDAFEKPRKSVSEMRSEYKSAVDAIDASVESETKRLGSEKARLQRSSSKSKSSKIAELEKQWDKIRDDASTQKAALSAEFMKSIESHPEYQAEKARTGKMAAEMRSAEDARQSQIKADSDKADWQSVQSNGGYNEAKKSLESEVASLKSRIARSKEQNQWKLSSQLDNREKSLKRLDELKTKFGDTIEESDNGWTPENHVKIAADDISKLRGQDVYRLLDNATGSRRRSMIVYLNKNRPDLSRDIHDAIVDLEN